MADMAFKRSAVRYRLSPPKNLISSEIEVFLAFTACIVRFSPVFTNRTMQNCALDF